MDQDLPSSSSSWTKLKVKEQEVEVAQEEVNPAIDSSAPLFHHITSVAFVLHLVYEVFRKESNVETTYLFLCPAVQKTFDWYPKGL